MSNLHGYASTLRALLDIPSRVARDASEDISAAIQNGFDLGQDPYGDAWAPLAAATLLRGRTPPPLTDTGAMRGGIVVRPAPGSGVQITTAGKSYEQVHLTGSSSRRLPARPWLPTRGLPPTWRAHLRTAYGVILRSGK